MKIKIAGLLMASVLGIVLSSCGNGSEKSTISTSDNPTSSSYDAEKSTVSTSDKPISSSFEAEKYETGNTSIVEGGKEILSNDLVSFSLRYSLEGYYDEDSDRYDICRMGWYTIQIKADENGQAVCRLNWQDHYEEEEPIQLDFTAGSETFSELQSVLSEAGILAINGFYGFNTALGTFIDLGATYESGEELSVYAEGGASATPQADIDAIIVYVNELAEKNGLRFTKFFGKEELKALFWEWIVSVLPFEADLETVEWTYSSDYDTVDIDAYDSGEESKWDAYARLDRQSGERQEGYYLYEGINEEDEMLNRLLCWIRENCEGAQERTDEMLDTGIVFSGSEETVSLAAEDANGQRLWEASAQFNRDARTISDIQFWNAVENGEEILYEEVISLP